jgi:hypothetical protein
LHHIVPEAQHGSDDIDNAIPVCFDCHAEIESRSNMGRHFSKEELQEHKRRWLEICRERPEVLVHSSRQNSQSGPLEALLSELEYNEVLVTGDDHRNDYVTLAAGQFDRAIAANALSSLEPTVQEQIFRTYKLITGIADLLQSRFVQRPGSSPYVELSRQIGNMRRRLREELEATVGALRGSLGIGR